MQTLSKAAEPHGTILISFHTIPTPILNAEITLWCRSWRASKKSHSSRRKTPNVNCNNSNESWLNWTCHRIGSRELVIGYLDSLFIPWQPHPMTALFLLRHELRFSRWSARTRRGFFFFPEKWYATQAKASEISLYGYRCTIGSLVFEFQCRPVGYTKEYER